MNFIIWSKDRASQLFLLLESMEKNIVTENKKIYCVYKASNSDYQFGYSVCRKRFPKVFFMEEMNFYDDSVSILETFSEKVCFLTDDTVFYSTTSLNEILQIYTYLNSNVSNIFSMRLGYNTHIQDHINGYSQHNLVVDKKEKDVVSWNPAKYPGFMNYGYPFAIDAHIYNVGFILPKVKSFVWKNTNELEGGLQKFNDKVFSLGSFVNSRAVNIPYNNLSGLTMTNTVNSCTLSGANQNLLLGKKIDIKTIEETKVVGCHQDIKLKWVNR